jgi:hypothetical protein
MIGTENNQGNIHKAKLNENGTFSVGKTWPLSELRGVEIINVCTTFGPMFVISIDHV